VGRGKSARERILRAPEGSAPGGRAVVQVRLSRTAAEKMLARQMALTVPKNRVTPELYANTTDGALKTKTEMCKRAPTGNDGSLFVKLRGGRCAKGSEAERLPPAEGYSITATRRRLQPHLHAVGTCLPTESKVCAPAFASPHSSTKLLPESKCREEEILAFCAGAIALARRRTRDALLGRKKCLQAPLQFSAGHQDRHLLHVAERGLPAENEMNALQVPAPNQFHAGNIQGRNARLCSKGHTSLSTSIFLKRSRSS
jgi:hypothetical protein